MKQKVQPMEDREFNTFLWKSSNNSEKGGEELFQ